MGKCIFCMIINREIPSEIVYEDDYCIAFKDINPQMPVHIVVASKRHAESVLGFSDNDQDAMFLGYMQLAIAKIARQLGLDKDGFRVINNCGSDAGQSVAHLHYHILSGKKMGEKIV